MCGRFTLTRNPVEAVPFLRGLPIPEPFQPRYNIAPGQLIWVTAAAEGRLRWLPVRWGLTPPWASGPATSKRFINARRETVFEKPAFRRAFLRRRCLIWADGFYEWHRSGRVRAQPYYIRFRDGGVFAMAGLWEEGHDPKGESELTGAILTMEAIPPVRLIHARMPLILPPESWEQWLLAPPQEARSVLGHLSPPAPEALEVYAVSMRVNDPRVDEPGLIDPLNT